MSKMAINNELNQTTKNGIIKLVEKAYMAIPEEIWALLLQPPKLNFRLGYTNLNNTWSPVKWDDKEQKFA